MKNFLSDETHFAPGPRIKIGNVTIGGQSAVAVMDSGFMFPPDRIIVTLHRGNFLTFTLPYYELNTEKAKNEPYLSITQTLNQILSTFQFVRDISDHGSLLYLAKTVMHEDDKNAPLVAFVVYLPDDASRFSVEEKGNKKIVTANSSRFIVETHVPAVGYICTFENDPACNYEEDNSESVNNIDTFIIRKNTQGIFALIGSTSVNGYNLDTFLIRKENPNNIFTREEIDMWKQLLSTIQLIKVEF